MRLHLGCPVVAVPIALGIAVTSVPASAQQLRGVVRDSTTGRPVRGAALTVRDRAGTMLARITTDTAGAFVIPRLPRAVAVRVTRIGFRPREMVLPRGTTSLDVLLGPVPDVLTGVEVSDKEVCPRVDDGGATFSLWDLARQALAAPVVDSAARPDHSTALLYARLWAEREEFVAEQRLALSQDPAPGRFVQSRPMDVIEHYGYIAELENGDSQPPKRIYYAPDAAVLSDPAFTTLHCFRPHEGGADSAGLAAIDFWPRPIEGRDTIAEIEGVIRIDRASGGPVSLDYKYTGLEASAMEAGAGGHLEFAALPSGIAFISGWHVRVPDLMVRPPRSIKVCSINGIPEYACSRGGYQTLYLRPTGPRQQRRYIVATRIRAQGGRLLTARWRDGTTWTAPPTGLEGRAVRTDGSPAAHALLMLAAGLDTLRADSTGAFAFVPMIPGRYQLTAIDTAFQRCASPRRTERPVEVTDGVGRVEIVFPAVRASRVRRCISR